MWNVFKDPVSLEFTPLDYQFQLIQSVWTLLNPDEIAEKTISQWKAWLTLFYIRIFVRVGHNIKICSSDMMIVSDSWLYHQPSYIDRALAWNHYPTCPVLSWTVTDTVPEGQTVTYGSTIIFFLVTVREGVWESLRCMLAKSGWCKSDQKQDTGWEKAVCFLFSVLKPIFNAYLRKSLF